MSERPDIKQYRQRIAALLDDLRTTKHPDGLREYVWERLITFMMSDPNRDIRAAETKAFYEDVVRTALLRFSGMEARNIDALFTGYSVSIAIWYKVMKQRTGRAPTPPYPPPPSIERVRRYLEYWADQQSSAVRRSPIISPN